MSRLLSAYFLKVFVVFRSQNKAREYIASIAHQVDFGWENAHPEVSSRWVSGGSGRNKAMRALAINTTLYIIYWPDENI
jgi:hypothetical protein